MGSSVKVMLSHNFCHFEISKTTDQDVDNKTIDDMRKDCMRLADKAVKQYQIAKDKASEKAANDFERRELETEVERILKIPESERTATQKAKVKALEDHEYWKRYDYDYEDDQDY
ncbi:MAG: hypothetical protein LLG40_13935 [Deltaproteobacteria bacterium]|nr:hypothetical protein [Deltaproteobacteria bacterium]